MDGRDERAKPVESTSNNSERFDTFHCVKLFEKPPLQKVMRTNVCIKKSSSGLSLIEILFSIAILAFLLAALAGGFQKLSASNASLKYQALASNDAKKTMEQVRFLADQKGLAGTGSVTDSSYWSNASGTGWLQTTSFSSLSGASRTVTFPDGTSQDPLHVRTTVTWQEKGTDRSYSLDTYVTKRT